MKGLRKKLENLMNAVSFAEANEHETALSFVGARASRKKKVSLDDMMTAITFAESGLPDMAIEFMQVPPVRQERLVWNCQDSKIWPVSIPVEDTLLAGVKIWYGTVPVSA